MDYFVTVADEGQITSAALKLRIAQPALSHAIAQLEARMGVKLFERHARGVTLTLAGERFLAKARIALEAFEEAELAAASVTSPSDNALEWGYIGVPPQLSTAALFMTFPAAHPAVEVSLRSLPFPCVSTAAWLKQVDVALCHSPTPHPAVDMYVLRSEQRVLLVAASHPLASRTELTVAEVLDETFCGTDPSLEPVRAGFWRLDDHRGEPAPYVSADRVANSMEMLAVVASGHAVTASPATNAAHLEHAMPGIVAIPLRDADPTLLTLAWRKDNESQHVKALLEIAASLERESESEEVPYRPVRRDVDRRMWSSPLPD
jgi:DNA-binding transcriptional LysR family regulator